MRAACFFGWPVVVGWPAERFSFMLATTSAIRAAFSARLAAFSSLEMALEEAPFGFCCFLPVIVCECLGWVDFFAVRSTFRRPRSLVQPAVAGDILPPPAYAGRPLATRALCHAASIPEATNRRATKGNMSTASCSLEMTDGRLHQRSLLAVVRSEPGSESFDRLACTFSSCDHDGARLHGAAESGTYMQQ